MLTTDPCLQEKVAIAIGARLRALSQSGDIVDERDTTFATTTEQLAEELVPKQERMTSGRRWNGGAETGAELDRVMTGRRADWKQLERGMNATVSRGERFAE